MAFDQRPQPRRFQHLDLVAPLIEMPGHFQPACGFKPDNQTAVVPIFGRLVGVELEFRRTRGCLGKKPPDDLAILGGVLISAEGLRRMIVQGKAGLDGKTLIETFGAVNAVQAKMAEILASISLASNEIAAQSQQEPMRLDRPGFCIGVAIDNAHLERSAQRLDQNVGDLRSHRDLWAWPRHLAQSR